ncbi:hypothetical protein ASPBRDRAFT_49321 [Aspergillus brasiliensis CBS 101740]|uniref:Uncharacterized protein n=1 Tax=Aspergillus brasiliensis (strain CBS 101740 / IMI 381727 / IBT 21946) TaxID=767769 RepID=A0A1L9U2W5_ASPBC|nr:hypothetical protein ASPBRDRAFT_49321 [Aspergillus brasiliensis CBS 101740]
MSLVSIMLEELKSLLLAPAKPNSPRVSVCHSLPPDGIPPTARGPLTCRCSSARAKFNHYLQLSYPTRKFPAEQEDAMLAATVGGTLEYSCGLRTDICKIGVLVVAWDHHCMQPP